ncbi:MAG: chemotaxis protein CheW [Gammaproteobacteria bacterium]|nr:chemotaxis protein CheW [Gammaproteobacteria bacterium]MDH5594942.1 chemotaxis protein CheW [Gammaproteobacteria bacterium]MDH5613750.1 chemotaxis protein CheW [Gammaproteobacteria bacterium]
MATAASTEAMQLDQRGVGLDGDNAQFLSFILAGEHYGIDILRVQEIKGWTPVTRVPQTPQHMKGVLNLRGTVVPIVDMRMRFSLEEIEYTPLTVVIVMSVKSDTGERLVGIVVDAVSDVLNVPAENIKPTPDFGDKVSTEFINGLASVDDKMVMLLDVDQLFNTNELPAEEILEQVK